MSKRLEWIVLWLAAVTAYAEIAPAHAGSVADFYQGNTVRIVVGFGAGGGYDLYARLVAEHLGQDIPGHPAVIVENMPGAGSLKAANYVYNAAARDGTVIGLFLNNFVLAKLLEPGAMYEPQKFTWLGRVDGAALYGVASKKSGVRSVEDAMKRNVALASTGASAMDAMVPWALDHLVGTRFKVIAGYKSNGEEAFALERGECDGMGAVSLQFLAVRKPEWLKEGTVRLIYLDDLKRDPAYPDVPTIAEFAKNEQDRKVLELIASSSAIGRSFVAPPGIPADRAAALRAAFETMLKDPAFLEDAQKRKLDVHPISVAALEKIAEAVSATPPAIIEQTKLVTAGPPK